MIKARVIFTALALVISALFAPMSLASQDTSASSPMAMTGTNYASDKDVLIKIIERGTLRVGTTFGTQGYYLRNDLPVGFEYEIAKGFANFLQVELEVVPRYEPLQLLDLLKQQKIDVIASPFLFSQNYLREVTFGPPYQYFDLVVAKRRPGSQAADYNAESMIVEQYSVFADFLQSSPTSDALTWQTTLSMDGEELLAQVADGELYATITDSLQLNRQRLVAPDLYADQVLLSNQPKRWLLPYRNSEALLGALLEYKGELRSSGKFTALEEAYYAHVQIIDRVDTRAFIRAVDKVLPKFKPWFKDYSGSFDWRLLAALSYQESHWKEDAVSPTGVRGLMMLTLPTASDLGVTDRTDSQQSIRGGSQYLASLYSRLPARITDPDRIFMAMAAYNVGLGHLEDARILTQRAGFNPDLWVDVKQFLPKLRQKQTYSKTRYGFARGDVAVKYVENIRRYYESLVYLDERQHLDADQESQITPATEASTLENPTEEVQGAS